MLHFDLSYFQEAFNHNWKDWCLGDEGGTRAGDKVECRPVSLVDHRRVDLPVWESLSKNPAETKRWHIRFLLGFEDAYFEEYLKSRYREEACRAKADKFTTLFRSIREHGVLKPIWVAEVDGMTFRFDGCHRSCCAFVCGMDTIPAIVFKTKELT